MRYVLAFMFLLISMGAGNASVHHHHYRGLHSELVHHRTHASRVKSKVRATYHTRARHMAVHGPFGRYNCGWYMRILTGGKYGPTFNLARTWASLPHTDAHNGAVVVQSRRGHALGGGRGGHVSRIVELRGPCRAVVQDDYGTYERDICNRLIAYVQP